MQKYVIRRLLLAVPVLLLSSLIVFGLMRVMPGDALILLMGESGNVSQKELAKVRKDLGLDRPYHEQYLLWLWQMVSFNPGVSIFTHEPIPVSLKKAIPGTLELATLAMVIGLVIAVPIGVLSATRQDKPADYAGRVVAVAGLSIPDFWLATLVITFAAIWVHWIPPIGYVSFWDHRPAAVSAAGGYTRLPPFLGDNADDALDRSRDLARGHVRTAWAKARGQDRRLQARAEERADPGRHRPEASSGPCWPGRSRADRAAGDGPLTVGDPLPGLSGRADQRDAGRGDPGQLEPARRSDARVARPAYPLPVRPDGDGPLHVPR
jgi:peptide/nickel transport system permease protein